MLAWCMVIGLLPNLATADTVVLRDNRQVTGRITGETAETVTIDSPSGRFTFSRTKILRLTKESKSQNHLRTMAGYLSQAQLDEAMRFYQRMNLETQTTPETFNALFMENLASTAGGIRCTSATATALADKFRKSLHPPPDLLLLAGALCADSGNYDTAHSVLKQAEASPMLTTTWPQATLSLLVNRIADVGVKRKRGDLIAVSTAIAARLPGSAAGQTDFLTAYAQIERLRRDRELLQAIAAFRPEMFLHRADLFTPLAERLLNELTTEPDNASTLAALESARVTLLPYVSAEIRLSSMKLLLNRLVAHNRTTDAQHLADEIAASDPDLGAELQHLVEYHNRRQSIPPDEPLQLYNLAAWARSMGLLDESKKLFLSLKDDPRFTENTTLQLSILETAMAVRDVGRLRKLFDAGKLDQLKIAAPEFLRTSPPEKYAQQARDLLQLADFQKWSGERSSVGKAEAEYQQAERLFNRREFDEAILYLNRIQVSGGDPAASVKAQLLRDKILQSKASQAAFDVIAPPPAKP